MAKIICPNKGYTGVSASIAFVDGVGYTSDPHLIQWCEDHGYTVVAKDPSKTAGKTAAGRKGA